MSVPRQDAGDRRPAKAPDDDLTSHERPASYLVEEIAAGLAALPVLRAALRRRAIVWIATALLGLALGAGLYRLHPPKYGTALSIVLTRDPGEDVLTDLSLAQSRTVAQSALRTLGSPESLSSFQASYLVQSVIGRVLQFKVSARTPTAATREADALARSFLEFRAAQIKARLRGVIAAVDAQISQASHQLATVTHQLASVAGPTSPAGRAQVASLEARRQQAASSLRNLNQVADTYLAGLRTQTASQMTGNRILSPAAPATRSRLYQPVAFDLAGMIAGLMLGMGLVMVSALVSSRPRRRSAVAAALGAPIRLSVGRVRTGRSAREDIAGQPADRSLRRIAGQPADRSLRRIAGYLRGASQPRPGGAVALAVVPIGDVGVCARSVAVLAWSLADDGMTVLVADLVAGAPLARLLGAGEPGIRTIGTEHGSLVVLSPDPDDMTPAGPLGHAGHRQPAWPDLDQAYGSAGALLTLATVDPALGGDHLATWATSAVVMVEAGKASATRIESVGEMIRQAGLAEVSGVLIGADKSDESYGSARQRRTEPAGYLAESVGTPARAGSAETG